METNMNERIRELARQAWDYAEENNPEPYRDMYDLCFEKFAELVVAECMQVAKKYQNRGGNCYVDKMINEHFGVEE
jgi:hypothetical protein